MADGSFPTLISKDTAANAATNPVFVQLTDGSAVIGVTSNALDVNIAGGSVTVNFSYVDSAAFTVTSDNVGAVGMLGDETSPNTISEGDIGIPRITLDRKQIMVIADPTTDSQRLAIDSSGRITSNINGTVTVDANSSNVTVDNGAAGAAVNIQDGGNTITVDGTVTVQDGGSSITVDASDLDIRNLTLADDAVKVSANTTANSATNPIYVSVVSAGVSTTEVQDYATTVDTGNNDYAVTGTTFLLKSVIFAASGGMKAEIQVGPVATLVTKAVGFIPHQGGTEQLFFDPPIEVPATSTGTVRVVMTNREGSAQSVYSTIIGNDIP